MNKNSKEYLAQKSESGICYDCTKTAEPGRKRCKKHLQKNGVRVKRYRINHPDSHKTLERALKKRRKESGICTRCGLVLGDQDAGHTKCQNCREGLI